MIVLALALVLEYLVGEPPVRWHVVVWMGKFLGWFAPLLPDEPAPAFLSGALVWCLGAGILGLGGVILTRWIWSYGAIGHLLEAILLWPLFSIRLLFSEVRGVEEGLGRSLEEGRAKLARIVSRDVSNLSESEVRESALESLSENLCDSVVAPFFWWALLGLPGTLVYRFANTADASWGFRGEWEHKGKWSARADDLLNWIPARITALFLGGFREFDRLRAEASQTPSPNGGWPMGALALALGIRLGKPGVYILNAEGRVPTSVDFHDGLRRCAVACALAVVGAVLLRVVGVRW